MMFAMLATLIVAILGHFIVVAFVRHLDTNKALRAYWVALAAGSLMLAAAGCGSSLGFGGPSKARPNRPGWVMGEFHTKDPETGERRYTSLTAQGAENTEEAMTATATKDGIRFNSGTSAPFKWATVTSNPAALFGCILFVAGIALLVIGKFPIAGFVIPGGAGWTCILGGAGLIALPFIADALKPVITIAAVLGGIGFAIYYGHKLKWFEKATDTDAIWDRLDKGDTGGAAAMAFLGSGGTATGKMKARAVRRNGNGATAALIEGATPLQPVTPPTTPEG